MLAYLLAPVAVIVGLSFNRPSSRLSYDFAAFTFDNWAHPCGPVGLCASLLRSVQIGLLATAYSRLGMRPARNASRPASTAFFMADAIITALRATKIRGLKPTVKRDRS